MAENKRVSFFGRANNFGGAGTLCVTIPKKERLEAQVERGEWVFVTIQKAETARVDGD